MKKIIALIFFISTLLISTVSAQQYATDIIVTSPDGIWTDSRAYSTLNDAIDAVGTDEREIVIVTPQTVTDLTIPSNVTLKFHRNGAINNTGQLTINTKNIEAPSRNIFIGTGDIDFADGSTIKASWFSNLYTALNLTQDDSLTMLIDRQSHLTTSIALGNNVILKWDSPNNIIQVDAGVTLSNIKAIEAGSYQIFAGLGDFDFLDTASIQSSWFQSLRDLHSFTDDEDVNLTIIIDRDETVDANTTFDEYYNFEFENGARLDLDSGVTVTIDSPANIIAADNQQIFTGDGDISWTGEGMVWASWFSNINDAISSGANHIRLAPETVYTEDGTDVNYPTGGFVLDGDGTSTIKLADDRDSEWLNTDGGTTTYSYIKIHNIRVDGNRSNGDFGSEVFHFSGSDTVTELSITDCVIDSAFTAIRVNSTVTTAIISRNRITDIEPHDGVTVSNVGQAIAFSSTGIKKCIIDSNIISGPSTITANEGPEGIFIYDGVNPTDASSEIIITNNDISYCGANVMGNLYGSIDLYHGAAEAIIANNKIHNYTYHGIRAHGGTDARVSTNNNHIYSPVAGGDGFGIASSAPRCIIANNIVSEPLGYGIASSGYASDPQYNESVSILGNVVNESADIGIYVSAAEHINISSNVIHSPADHGIRATNIVDASNVGTTTICGNTIYDAGDEDSEHGIYVSGTHDEVLIANNNIHTARYYGISVNPLASAQVLIQGNKIEGTGNGGIHTGNNAVALVIGNYLSNIGAASLDPGSNTTIKENYGIDETVTTDGGSLQHWGASYIDSSSNKVDKTLPDGMYAGQTKIIVMTDASNASDITVTSHDDVAGIPAYDGAVPSGDGEIGTFNAVDDTWILMWTGTEWTTLRATCSF